MKNLNKERGQGLVEYALLLILVAVVVIGALRLIAPELNTSFKKVINALTGTPTTSYRYEITNLNVKLDDACKYELMARIIVTDEAGNPVANLDLPVTASLSSPVASKTFTPKTDASGVAKIEDNVIYAYSGACQHGTATISVENGAMTTSIGY